jgi:hypothetical protein
VVIIGGNRLESFLTGGIPDLELDLLPSDVHGPDLEVNTDRRDIIVTESLIGKLKEETALAHSGIANDEDFVEQIRVGHGENVYLELFLPIRSILSSGQWASREERGLLHLCYRSDICSPLAG